MLSKQELRLRKYNTRLLTYSAEFIGIIPPIPKKYNVGGHWFLPALSQHDYIIKRIILSASTHENTLFTNWHIALHRNNIGEGLNNTIFYIYKDKNVFTSNFNFEPKHIYIEKTDKLLLNYSCQGYIENIPEGYPTDRIYINFLFYFLELPEV